MSKQFRVLAIAVIAVLFVVVGCGANPRQFRQMIVGRWVLAEGSSRDVSERMEFLADGTGLAESGNKAMTFQWRIDDDNRIISTAMNGSITQIYTIREISRTTLIVEWQGVRLTYKSPQEAERLARERERVREEAKRERVAERAREEAERERLAEQARRTIQQRSGAFTDPRDGQTYRTVKIGNLTWMAQNLNFQTNNSWCYDSNNSNCEKYGRLYTWRAARNACPAGWRLPGGVDWDALMSVVGSTFRESNDMGFWDGAGTRFKSQAGWNNNGNGTDDFGFSALPGGNRRSDGRFLNVGLVGFWWITLEGFAGEVPPYLLGMGSANEDVYTMFLNLDWSNGHSVRCVSE